MSSPTSSSASDKAMDGNASRPDANGSEPATSAGARQSYTCVKVESSILDTSMLRSTVTPDTSRHSIATSTSDASNHAIAPTSDACEHSSASTLDQSPIERASSSDPNTYVTSNTPGASLRACASTPTNMRMNASTAFKTLKAPTGPELITDTTPTKATGSSPSVPHLYDNGYNWEQERRDLSRFSDDGTKSFFWQAHTLTVLAFLVGLLLYVGLIETPSEDSEFNTKRGIFACVSVFILLGVTITPDGPFVRPHPSLWRFVFCVSIVYQMALIFVLFQSAMDARLLLKHLDHSLGVPLEEKSYGGNCRLYDHEVPDDPFHNIWDKLDLFVPMHFFGWWLKTLVLRDYWLCFVVSIMFELLEYTFEHQLPNFSECWWDHWILDAFLCNGAGIMLGMMTLKRFQARTYHWRGLWNIPTYKEKFKRIIAQFGPHWWVDYEWKPTSSFGRWMSVLGIAVVFLFAELNTFYLKFVLWVPPGHMLNLFRLFCFLFWGAVGLRETFQYLDDRTCKSFGRQSWVIVSIVCTEFLIVAKFGWDTITIPLPRHVAIFWLIGLLCLTGWTIYNFKIKVILDKRASDARLKREMIRKGGISDFAGGESSTEGASPVANNKLKTN